MSGINARAEIELKLDDDWLDSHVGDQAAVVNVVTRTPIEAFAAQCRTLPLTGNAKLQPRGFRIDAAIRDEEASTAWINATLLAHQLGSAPIRDRYACAIMHPEALHEIYAYGTTARGISIYA